MTVQCVLTVRPDTLLSFHRQRLVGADGAGEGAGGESDLHLQVVDVNFCRHSNRVRTEPTSQESRGCAIDDRTSRFAQDNGRVDVAAGLRETRPDFAAAQIQRSGDHVGLHPR
jgi:hypothetical protein